MTNSYPTEFVEQSKALLGGEWEALKEALDTDSSLSIRFNAQKPVERSKAKNVPWCAEAVYLAERPSFTLDPAFHAGAYYVQEAASMFVGYALAQLKREEPVRVLDLCAAPGGKSTHIASLLSKDDLLVSNEVIKLRANILSENLKKWGATNVVVTNADPQQWGKLEGAFDVIVVDAPCSGEGMFRKDTEAIKEWSAEHVQLCAARQKRILADVWPALKNEGILIYSTCTYNKVENEEVINWMVKEYQAEGVPLQFEKNWGIVEGVESEVSTYRFYPHLVQSEGFFMSVVRKKAYTNEWKEKRNKKPLLQLADKKEIAQLDKIVHANENTFFQHNSALHAFPSAQFSFLEQLVASVKIVHAGTEAGSFKQQKFIPAHALALSSLLKKDAFPRLELSKQQALQYLAKQEMEIAELPKQTSWHLITYQELPLGWIKNLGNRINNYYPQEWRIRMDIS